MILYPAIDLKDGQCVRLLRGDMNAATVFSDSPADQAEAFVSQGFEWLHVVDLDGAFAGKPENERSIKSILARLKNHSQDVGLMGRQHPASEIKVQLGGGLRNMDVIARWLNAGISRVILGTVAQKNPVFVKEACRQFAGQIAVGIDAKNGFVATDGWAKTTETKARDLALRFEDAGVCAIIYTDIARDGAMEGPNFEETISLAEQLSTPVIASGGISSVTDIQRYAAHREDGIEGCILGRALYEGAIDVKEALTLAKKNL